MSARPVEHGIARHTCHTTFHGQSQRSLQLCSSTYAHVVFVKGVYES